MAPTKTRNDLNSYLSGTKTPPHQTPPHSKVARAQKGQASLPPAP
jgi:hypothetical protein